MDAQRETILLVEDDDDVRGAVAAMLEMEGYCVVEATHGAEALGHLRAGVRPCVILLDMMMPVMDGWEFRRRQLADPSLAAIPVIVVSADSQVQTKSAWVAAVDYLKKPVEFDVLIGSLEQHC